MIPGAPTGQRRPQAGFTLVELTVVIVLISLFMVFSIPLFGNIGTSRLDSSARRLAGTVKFLYNEAAMTGREHRLTFDFEQGSYHGRVIEVDGELVAAGDQGRQAALKGATRFDAIRVPGRGRFTMGQVTIRFAPTGWVDETVIHLSDDRQQRTLRIMPLTGTTEIYSGHREFGSR
ncbi:MAG: prepilin-type N-terminal cleavage/methylation domain-containing protein [Desulfuromonadales bacterium]|nr:prepilin-type N-terminal cleavage/methylation domain-containing protein [Desulfuromonadales bacterium]